MPDRFGYIIDRINSADFSVHPFRHLYIDNLFTDEDFRDIVASPEINFQQQKSDDALFDALYQHGYKVIEFPGCVTDIKAYKKWRAGQSAKLHNNSACEGFGVTLRLFSPTTPIITELMQFIAGDAFNLAIADKFAIKFENMKIDGGIQKYLDGYEISPHPDMRRKAATFMVNINPHRDSETFNHHTHYLKLRDSHRYVQNFWEGNPHVERCWIPWHWCQTEVQQVKNNSIVLFSPADDTLHGVKAAYDHLLTQRTQLYGNLWYVENPVSASLEWEKLALSDIATRTAQPSRLRAAIDRRIASPIKRLGRLVSTPRHDIGDRGY